MYRICLAIAIFCGVVTAAEAQRVMSFSGESYLSNLLDSNIPFDTASIKIATTDITFDVENAWKGWTTVENFTYGKDRGSLPMIADLHSLHPYFRDRVVDLIKACKAQGIELAVVESFRTHAKQSEYFGMGRKYTRSKGGKSKHQYGLAVDVVPLVNGVAQWDDDRLWRRVGVIGERIGLRWGGRWKAPYDPAHFEWTDGTTTTHLSKGVFPVIPRSKVGLYPCIEEQIEQLAKYWEAWEIEQAVTARSTKSRRVGPDVKP
jgi:hypothetical protein